MAGFVKRVVPFNVSAMQAESRIPLCRCLPIILGSRGRVSGDRVIVVSGSVALCTRHNVIKGRGVPAMLVVDGEEHYLERGRLAIPGKQGGEL